MPRTEIYFSDIPRDVHSLVREHVNSFEALRTLLWMYKFRSIQWSSFQLQAQLRLGSPLEEALAVLETAQLIRAQSPALDPFYRYAPATLALARTVCRLQRRFDSNPVAIMQLMSDNAIERVRGSAMRAFADAFLIGKGKTRG